MSDQVSEFRFVALRQGATEALMYASMLLHDKDHAGPGNYLEPENRYHYLVRIVESLSTALKKGTEE